MRVLQGQSHGMQDSFFIAATMANSRYNKENNIFENNL